MKKIPYTYNYYQNCGGYALNREIWLDFKCIPEPAFYFDDVPYYFKAMCDELLTNYPHLKRVDEKYARSIKHLDEELIAFRVSKDDFHFCVRRNRKWSMKAGANCIFKLLRKEVFADKWVSPDECYTYDSPIVWFITIP